MPKGKNNQVMRKFTTVDEYFTSLSMQQREPLEAIRQLVRTVAPEAEEVISYNMPAFRYKGILVYYAAHTNHVALYPASLQALSAFGPDLAGLQTSKGTIQFPLGSELPVSLVERIVRFRINENDIKAISSKKRKTKTAG